MDNLTQLFNGDEHDCELHTAEMVRIGLRYMATPDALKAVRRLAETHDAMQRYYEESLDLRSEVATANERLNAALGKLQGSLKALGEMSDALLKCEGRLGAGLKLLDDWLAAYARGVPLELPAGIENMRQVLGGPWGAAVERGAQKSEADEAVGDSMRRFMPKSE